MCGSSYWCRTSKSTKVDSSRTSSAKREVDLHSDIAEYLQRYTAGKTGLLFHTANNTPHLYSNLEDRWLTPRLVEMNLDEEGMGWHFSSDSAKPGCVVSAA